MAEFRVGVATVDITPRAGLPLLGNFRDDYAARGTHDPLLAKALVFADSRGAQAAVLALDLCMLDRQNVACIRRQIDEACDVPPDAVLVHATHTHSGPATNDRYLLGYKGFDECRGEIEALLARAASAVAEAQRNLAPATLALGQAREERVAFNRRLRRHDGTTQMNWEALAPGFDATQVAGAWGPTDPQLQCLTIERDGSPAAALVNFGLHPAILAGDNWLYSADYPGYLAEGLGRTLGSAFTSVFLNGPCGNVNHVDYRDAQQGRGYVMTQRVGYMLAAAAAEAIRTRKPLGGDRVAVSREMVELPRIQIDEADRARCAQIVEEARRHPDRGLVDGLPEAFFAERKLAMHRVQTQPDLVEVMAIRIGDLAIVGLPGENFAESGLAIKAASPLAATLVVGLANDSIGYLPTQPAFAQGGYEATIGSTVYQPGAAERLVEAAVRQVEMLNADR